MAESGIAHKALKLLLTAYVATVNWCSLPCANVKAARSITNLEIPRNATINSCEYKSEIINEKIKIVLTLNTEDYARVRAEATQNGYSEIPPLDTRNGSFFRAYYGEAGLIRELETGGHNSVVLRDSTRQIMIDFSAR